jgi:pimeloyl-ACP methyl ester carboxylesterase
LFLDGRTFVNFGPLADAFELIAIELPHASPFYNGKQQDFSGVLQDFIDTLELKDLYLGGVSLGGQIALLYMVQDQTTNVLGLALISTDMVKTEKELKKAKRVASVINRLVRNDDDRLLYTLNKLAEHKRKNAEGESVKAMEIFQLKHPLFYREVLNITGDMKSLPELMTIGVPTLIIHGDNDLTIPIDKARHLVDHIPNATFKTVEGGEHTVAYTRGEMISAMIRDFYSQK